MDQVLMDFAYNLLSMMQNNSGKMYVSNTHKKFILLYKFKLNQFTAKTIWENNRKSKRKRTEGF